LIWKNHNLFYLNEKIFSKLANTLFKILAINTLQNIQFNLFPSPVDFLVSKTPSFNNYAP